MQNKIVNDLKALDILDIKENEPLYKYTTYKVGGPALVFVSAHSFSDITKTIDYALENKIKYFVLGNGSNVLIADKFFNGIVINTRHLNSFEINNNEVYAMCGTNLIELAYKTAHLGLSGLEFSSGIPGCIGGAIFMNAGAYKKSFSDIVKRVLIYRNGKQEWLNNKEMEFSYRNSILQKHRDWIILAVELELEFQEKNKILELIEKRRDRRRETQPYASFSAGSVFKNPSDDLFSWQLIDQVGMRGYHINDAQVSLKHSNFIVNNDRASAQDIYDLITIVHKKIKEKTSYDLKIEVELVNFNDEKE